MSRKLTIVAFALIGSLSVGLGYYSYFSPIRTLENIKTAAKEGDRDRLRDLIDFDSVRGGLKEDLKARLVASTTEAMKDNPLAALSIAMANMIVDPLVDSIISPAGIATLVDKGRVNTAKESISGNAIPKVADTPVSEDAIKIDRGYDEFSRYRVRIRNAGMKADQMLTLTLRREGLFSWKLSSVTLPSDVLGDATGAPKAKSQATRGGYLKIHDSELQQTADRDNGLVLSLALLNNAPFELAIPHFELSLMDHSDKVIARRVITPTEYIFGSVVPGIVRKVPSNSRNPIYIRMETSAPRSTNYRLYAFYPDEDSEPATRQINAEAIRVLRE